MTTSHIKAYILVSRARTTLEKWMTSQLKSTRLNIAQFRLLDLLVKNGAASPADCSVRLGISTSSVTTLSDQLVSKQYIIRTRVQSDRRSLQLQLTHLGIKAHGDAVSAMETSQQNTDDGLPVAYFTALNTLLECMELLPGDRLSVMRKNGR